MSTEQIQGYKLDSEEEKKKIGDFTQEVYKAFSKATELAENTKQFKTPDTNDWGMFDCSFYRYSYKLLPGAVPQGDIIQESTHALCRQELRFIAGDSVELEGWSHCGVFPEKPHVSVFVREYRVDQDAFDWKEEALELRKRCAELEGALAEAHANIAAQIDIPLDVLDCV